MFKLGGVFLVFVRNLVVWKYECCCWWGRVVVNDIGGKFLLECDCVIIIGYKRKFIIFIDIIVENMNVIYNFVDRIGELFCFFGVFGFFFVKYIIS